MALQIWLPLNGDIHNQGLNNVAITNNGATVNNSGKIGKCYSFNGSPQKISTSISPVVTSAIGSLACWVKFSSLPSSSDWFCLMQLGALGGFASCRLGVYFEKATGINISINGSSTGANYQAYTFSTGVWYHICATYDGSKVKLYINGQEKMNKTATLGSYTTIASNLFIGGTSSYWMNGYMNDIRYYNHALSVKEVEEIAKGLVLHYKLDQSNPNLIIPSTFGTAPWKTAIQAQEVYQGKLAYRIANYILYTNTSRGVDTVFPNITFKENTQYTLSVDWRDDYRTDGKNSSLYFRFQYSDGSTATQIISPSNTIKQWIHSSMTSIAGKTVSKITTTYGSGDELYITNLKLEEGSIETPYTNDNNSTIIYDCSGYRNNGTIIGDLTAAAGSPRYKINTFFNGEDSCIQVPYNQACPENIFTINLWFCKNALGSKNYETLFGGPSGFEMDTRAGSATTLSLYMASTRGGNVFSPFNFNEWYMVTMVRDGTNELYYINGELKKTTEAKSMPTGNYFIGAWQTAVKQNYYGNMSDFRIYATALSAAAIKELYTTSLKIVSGNPVARELSEL